MDFKQFQQQYNQLIQNFPPIPSQNYRNQNADFGNYLVECNNAYYCFDTSVSENIMYLYDSYKAKSSYDGDYVIECELCYECVDPYQSYNCIYCNYIARLYDSAFCWDCHDSHHLFGCVHLKQKQYCVFNKQYDEQTYTQKVKELIKQLYEVNLQQMHAVAARFPVTQSLVSFSENADFGNHIDFSKDMYLCFDTAHCEDCAFCWDAHQNHHCYDLTQTFLSQFSYECSGSARLNNCYFIDNCGDLTDCGFCNQCSNSNHLFGCTCLDNQEYCILNKKYTPEAYEKEKNEIMKSFQGNLT